MTRNCSKVQDSYPALAFKYILEERILRQKIKVPNDDSLWKSLASTLGWARHWTITGEINRHCCGEPTPVVARSCRRLSLFLLSKTLLGVTDVSGLGRLVANSEIWIS